jgi:hypothetical protein
MKVCEAPSRSLPLTRTSGELAVVQFILFGRNAVRVPATVHTHEPGVPKRHNTVCLFPASYVAP